MTCSRRGCDETENLMVHSRKERMDGTMLTRYYCRPCQNKRMIDYEYRRIRNEFRPNSTS